MASNGNSSFTEHHVLQSKPKQSKDGEEEQGKAQDGKKKSKGQEEDSGKADKPRKGTDEDAKEDEEEQGGGSKDEEEGGDEGKKDSADEDEVQYHAAVWPLSSSLYIWMTPHAVLALNKYSTCWQCSAL